MSAIDIRKWKTNKNIQLIFKILEKNGEETRFIGGCVRDWITGFPVKDIDFATKHPPIKCSELLEKKGFKVKPVGIEHGTIKVILKGKIFEITTLRKDIITDGRHAVVKFGKDWYGDACRRDFTLNALYGDDQGTIYDPLNKGFKDLQEGKLCFIGNPQKRIKEDFLRIIRYFRFLSRISKNIHEDLRISFDAKHFSNNVPRSGNSQLIKQD